jgi:hypothetical protein
VDRAREMTPKEPQYNGFIYFYIAQPFSGKNSLMFAKGARPMYEEPVLRQSQAGNSNLGNSVSSAAIAKLTRR